MPGLNSLSHIIRNESFADVPSGAGSDLSRGYADTSDQSEDEGDNVQNVKAFTGPFSSFNDNQKGKRPGKKTYVYLAPITIGEYYVDHQVQLEQSHFEYNPTQILEM